MHLSSKWQDNNECSDSIEVLNNCVITETKTFGQWYWDLEWKSDTYPEERKKDDDNECGA